MTDQYPRPGQPGEPQPPTQIAGGVPPQQPGYPQQPPQPGGYPQQPHQPGGYPQQPGAPYGAPGGPGGYPPGGPGGYPAPPTGGGGKKVGLIIGIVVLVLVLVGGGATAAILAFSGDDDPKPKRQVTKTVTASEPAEATETTATETATEDVVEVPAEDPTITAQAYLNSLVEGNCLAVEGLSTPEWFASEFGDAAGCKAAAGDAEMSGAQYTFQDPVDDGSGSVTITADIVAPDKTKFVGTWTVVPADDTWLVDSFLLV